MQDNNNSFKDKQIRVDLIQVLTDVRDEFLQKLWLWLAIGAAAGIIGFASAALNYSPYYAARSSFTVSKHETVNYHTSVEKSLASYWLNIVSPWFGIVSPDVIGGDTLRELVKDDLGYQTAYDVLQSALKIYTTKLAGASGGAELQIIEEASLPTAPANSSGAKNSGVKAFLVGLFACLVWLTAKAILKKTVRSEEEVTALLGAEYLGKIPFAAYIKSRKNRAAEKAAAEGSGIGVPAEFADAVQKVRLHLENEADQTGAKTIVVTSALRNEGKTSTAAHLAMSLARKDYNVLLIDGDLRTPAVREALDLGPSKLGTADLLAGKCGLNQVLVNYKGSDRLVVIPGGQPVDNPEELWGSRRAEELIRKCSRQCDYVIIDAPAGGLVAEPALIAGCSDGWIYVVRRDYARTETILEGRETMEGAGCKLLGYVLTA